MLSRTVWVAAVALVAATAACGPRQVEVRTAPSARTDGAVRVTNGLGQPVNVYVLAGGEEIFLRQVGANATERLPVRGVAEGSTVRLRAVTIDGSRTYTSDPVVLQGTYAWRLP